MCIRYTTAASAVRRQGRRLGNHSNSPPQLKCLCSPAVTRKVKTRLKTKTSFPFKASVTDNRGCVTLHLLVHLTTMRPGGYGPHLDPTGIREQPRAWSPLRRRRLALPKRAKGSLRQLWDVHNSQAKKYFLPDTGGGISLRILWHYVQIDGEP